MDGGGDGRDLKRGFLFSLSAHVALLYIALFHLTPDNTAFIQPEIYSVTFEGGKKLGGIAQVPAKNADKQLAPPKLVKEQEPQPPKVEVKEPAKKEPAVEQPPEVPDAEVSLSESTPVPTATPKPKATQKPKPPAATPTPKIVKKQPAKPTAAPKPKEPSLSDINKQLEQAMQRYRGESSRAGGTGFGAARIGGSGMGGGVVRPPEFFAYLRVLEGQIKQGWKWYDNTTPLIAQVVFRISENGDISDIRISSSSGISGFDDSVLRAVKKASPVPPPPPIVYEYFREVRMTFDPRE